MRFLLFNAIVGLALVYLFNGGELSLNGLQGGFRESVAAVQETAEQAARKVKRQLHVADAPKPAVASKPQPKGYAKDVIPAPKPTPPVPVKRKQTNTPPPPPPVPGAKMAEPRSGPKIEPLPLPRAQMVAERPAHKIDESKAVKHPVAARRDEVLGNGPVDGPTQGAAGRTHGSGGRVALKEGTSLMSASERRRQLDDLAEEMEMLYLEKIGG